MYTNKTFQSIGKYVISFYFMVIPHDIFRVIQFIFIVNCIKDCTKQYETKDYMTCQTLFKKKKFLLK